MCGKFFYVHAGAEEQHCLLAKRDPEVSSYMPSTCLNPFFKYKFTAGTFYIHNK